MKLSRIVLAGATGAALAYFFDPHQGARRRNEARDRTQALLRRRGRMAMRTAEQATTAAASAPARAARRAKPAPPYDDDTLADVVMTHLFEDTFIKSRLNVSAQDGVVVLIGEVDDPEAIVQKTKAIKGVGEVKSLLHRPGTPAPHMA